MYSLLHLDHVSGVGLYWSWRDMMDGCLPTGSQSFSFPSCWMPKLQGAETQGYQGGRRETRRKPQFLQGENNPQRATSVQKASDYKAVLWSWRGLANFQLKSTGNISGMALFQICNPGSHVANSKTSVWQKTKSFHFGFGFCETRVGGQILRPAVLFLLL